MHRSGLHYLFSGGGTGGHLFPAVAVAERVRATDEHAKILFVGTADKIESRVVPQMGFGFKSVWIQGLTRRLTAGNLLFPVKLAVAFFQGLWINMRFKPDVAVGSGGYASYPAIVGASVMGAKIVLLEQNSYPGLTTRLLERYADEVHISFAESSAYFRSKEKLKLSGNPVRLPAVSPSRQEALSGLGLNPAAKAVLVLGGSLGARAVNNAVVNALPLWQQAGLQVIWQSGSAYYEEYKKHESGIVRVLPFIEDMNSAYAAADLLVARAGATTIAEITARGVAAVLIPSPNVANDHQRFNARSLSEAGAAITLEDAKSNDELGKTVLHLVGDDTKLAQLSASALRLGKPKAADVVAASVMRLAAEGRGYRA